MGWRTMDVQIIRIMTYLQHLLDKEHPSADEQPYFDMFPEYVGNYPHDVLI